MTTPTQHTAEPWDDASRYPEFQSIRIFAKTHFIATVGNRDDTKAQTEANAARIVTCVNACAGISDPAATLKAVREALEEAKSDLAGFEFHVGGRIPADSSDSISIEGIQALRIASLLPLIDRALRLLTPNQDAKV